MKKTVVSLKSRKVEAKPLTKEEIAQIEAERAEAAKVKPEQVKEEARRRIEATGLAWMVEREVSGGAAIPQQVKAKVASIRAASNKLEGMSPIPRDYTKDKWWN